MPAQNFFQKVLPIHCKTRNLWGRGVFLQQAGVDRLCINPPCRSYIIIGLLVLSYILYKTVVDELLYGFVRIHSRVVTLLHDALFAVTLCKHGVY